MSSQTSPETLSTYLLEDSHRGDHQHTLAALEHRQILLSKLQIPAGAKVLEIGCGQGDFTVVIADLVGPDGHVTGVDPGDLEYGTPTLGQGRAHVLSSAMGSRITFIQDDPTHFLASATTVFDYIIFMHCIWYFATPTLLPPMLALALQRAPRLCIAEYALSTTLPEAFPHVLVAMSVNTLESMRSDASKRNIRTAVSPAQIKRMVVDARWSLVDEEIVQPGPGQRDGEREVWMGLHPVFDSHVELLDVEDRVKSMLLGMKDAVASSVEKLEGGLAGVRNMDVWAARFERGNASELAS